MKSRLPNPTRRSATISLLASGATFALTGLAAAMLGAGTAQAQTPYRSPLPVEGHMTGFDGATTWLNSAPLTPQSLRGKVVLVDFWTYSCINCIRTVPYARAWAQKYRSAGLVVVGVHTPEFKFEEDLVNINAAVARFKIDYPIAVDSTQRIWRNWGNQFWPAFYLVDANGKIRHHQFGEGDYDKMERAIQSLLQEAHPGVPLDTALVKPAPNDEQMAPDLNRLGSDETYVGYGKATNMRSMPRVREDRPQTYTVDQLRLNDWGLSGAWVVGEDSAVSDGADAAVAYQFSARDLHLVMGPATAGNKLRIKVTLDGQPPGADHGADVDADGNGMIDATRLYQLVRQNTGVRQRRFEIRFLDKGARVFAFTFG